MGGILTETKGFRFFPRPHFYCGSGFSREFLWQTSSIRG